MPATLTPEITAALETIRTADRPSRVAPTWSALTPEQRRVTLHAMYRYGGTYIEHLADLLMVADEQRAERHAQAAKEDLVQYLPGGEAYQAALPFAGRAAA